MAAKEYVWKQRPGTGPYIFQLKKPSLGERPISVRDNYVRAVTGCAKPVWMPLYSEEVNICWPDVIEEHPVPEVTGKDWWGVEWIMQEDINGMMVAPGTRVISDFENWREDVKWPDLEAPDWAYDGEKISSNYDPDRPHVYQCVEGLFERLHELMPFEETLEAMILEPESALEFFEKMADYKIGLCTKVFEHYGRIDGVLYHDDWGFNLRGFFSNQMFSELLVPPTKRLIQFIKNSGRFVELHSCGKNEQYVPYMIEMGIDMWCPQNNINDVHMLKNTYGDKMTFVAGIQGLDAPNMTEPEIRDTVRAFVDEWAPGGRMLASLRLPPSLRDRAVIAKDELYKYSMEFYKTHD